MELDKEKAALVLPFPEDCLVELGRLSVAFSYLASVLDLAVWILVDAEDPKVGSIVTLNRPFSRLLDLARELSKHRIDDKAELERFESALKKAECASKKRNKLVHSYWFQGEGIGSAEARKLRRDRDTCVKMQSQEHSAASILAIVSETYEAAQAIDGMLLCLSGLNKGGSRS